MASSIFTITAMAVDRYLAIARPFGLAYRCFNKTTTVIMIIALWITSLLMFVPVFMVYRLHVDEFPIGANKTVSAAICTEQWSDFPIPQYTMGIIWFVFMFALPGKY